MVGEWFLCFDGCVDVVKYVNVFKECENVWIFLYGGYIKCFGMEFIVEVKISFLNIWFIFFEFFMEQVYVLEFGDEYMRVFKDGGVVFMSGVGSVVYEIVTPYAAVDLDGICYIQFVDIMYLVYCSYVLCKLIWVDYNDWSINFVDFLFWFQGLMNIIIIMFVFGVISGDGIIIIVVFNFKVISGVVNNGSGFICIIATAHGFFIGVSVYIMGVIGIIEVNGIWIIN